MGLIADPVDRFAVISAMGDVCSFDLMEKLTVLCYGKSVINEIAARDDNQVEIATKTYAWAERVGVEEEFISIVLRATENNKDRASETLRLLVKRVLPSAFEAPPSVASQVEQVVVALKALGTSLGDEEIRAAIHGSRTELNLVVGRIRTLLFYKTLHDNLHRIQLSSKRQLLSGARKINQEETRVDSTALLDNFLQSVFAAIVNSRTAILQLGQQGIAKRESLWLDEMDRAYHRCRKGLFEGDAGRVKIGINLTYAIIDEHSPRLNDQIFAETTALPLSELGEQLTLIRAKSGFLAPQIDSALKAIGELGRILISRVAAHNRLQTAERNLSILAECFGDSEADMILPQFTDLWPETKTTAKELSSFSRDSALIGAQQVYDQKYTDAVDGRLVENEAAADNPITSARLLRLLDSTFSNFYSMARRQFFALDGLLKLDFEKLKEIASSLQNVLGDSV